MRLASAVLTWFMQMPSVSCLLFEKAEQQRKHSGRKNVHFCRFREERNKYNGAYYVILYEMKCLAVSYLHRFTISVIGAEWSELCCVPSCVCVPIPLLTPDKISDVFACGGITPACPQSAAGWQIRCVARTRFQMGSHLLGARCCAAAVETSEQSPCSYLQASASCHQQFWPDSQPDCSHSDRITTPDWTILLEAT